MPMRQVPGLSVGSTVLHTEWEDDCDASSSDISDGTTGIMTNDLAHSPAQYPCKTQQPSAAPLPQHQQHQQQDVFPALNAIKTAVDRAQRPGQIKPVVPLQGMGNGVAKQRLAVWVPEALIANAPSLQKKMPCPHCSSTRAVDDGEWPADFWFVHEQDTFVVAKQYACQSCNISFRGWHPKTLQALPREVACQFPVSKACLASDKSGFLYRTAPLKSAMHSQTSFGNQTVADPEMLFRSTSEFSLSCQSLPNIDIEKLVEGEGEGACDLWGSEGAEVLDSLEPIPLNRNSSFFTGGRAISISGGFPDFDASAAAPSAAGFSSSFLPQHAYAPQHEPMAPMPMQHHPQHNPRAFPTPATAAAGFAKPHDRMAFDSPHSMRETDRTPPFSPEAQEMVGGDDILSATSPDASMAHASMTATRRSIQFCSVCFGVRRQSGQLVAGHRPDGFCPVKKRKATTQEKRELRRRRQKMRRAIKKRKGPLVAAA